MRRRLGLHRESLTGQTVQVAGHAFAFRRSETIHSGISGRFTLDRFAAQAMGTGFAREATWTDKKAHFAAMLLRA